MKKLLFLFAALLPVFGFAEDWPPLTVAPTITMNRANPVYAQPELNLVLAPAVSYNLTFYNIVPWDQADMYICPPGKYNLDNPDGVPSQFYSKTPLSMKTCDGTSCSLNFSTDLEWYGIGSGTPLTDPLSYDPSGDTVLPAGDYDVVWRLERDEADAANYSSPAPNGGKSAAQKSDMRASAADSKVHIMAVKSSVFTIKSIQDNMAAGTDGGVVEVKDNNGKNTIYVDPNRGVLTDAGTAKLNIKLDGSVTAAAVFLTGADAGLKDSLVAFSAADPGAQFDGVPFDLDALKKGVSVGNLWGYVEQTGNMPPIFDTPQAGTYVSVYDDCLYGYWLKKGRFNLTVVYMIDGKVYYKTAVFNVEYGAPTGLESVKTADVKIYMQGDNIVINGSNVKDVTVYGINAGTVYQGGDQSISASGFTPGVYIVTVTTKDGSRAAVQKIIKK